MEHNAVIQGRYRLEALRGEGGFGSVWSANQIGLDRRVAIKFLKPGDAQMMRRFAVEARALGRLNHRNCVARVGLHRDVRREWCRRARR